MASRAHRERRPGLLRGLGNALEEAAIDREDAAILAARAVPSVSSSRVPGRCGNCREWAVATRLGACPKCGGAVGCQSPHVNSELPA